MENTKYIEGEFVIAKYNDFWYVAQISSVINFVSIVDGSHQSTYIVTFFNKQPIELTEYSMMKFDKLIYSNGNRIPATIPIKDKNTDTIKEIIVKSIDFENHTILDKEGNHFDFEQVEFELNQVNSNKFTPEAQRDTNTILKKVEIYQHDFFGELDTSDDSIFDDRKSLEFELHQKMNVLAGENGYGKTFLLKIIASKLNKEPKTSWELQQRNELLGEKGKINITYMEAGKNVSTHHVHTIDVRPRVYTPILCIPSIRYLGNDEYYTLGSASGSMLHDTMDKFINGDLLTDLARGHISALIGDYYENESSFGSPIFEIYKKVFKTLTGERGFSFQKIERDIEDNSHYKVFVHTEATPENYLIPLHKASLGTHSVLILFGFVYRFLKALHSKEDIPENEIVNQIGIVIIDEIEANLHIKWQKKILYLLEEIFPNVQFIVSTHSPFIVSGREKGQVFALKQYKNTKIVVDTYYDKDFINDSIDDIMLEIFDEVDSNQTRDKRIKSLFSPEEKEVENAE
ncbi:MAG: hypothetical protein EAZ44_00970 [Cytophagia bacterium]|nr:MAG: hypothetical protein EAZ44_00970 [Cytophagia bacterium]